MANPNEWSSKLVKSDGKYEVVFSRDGMTYDTTSSHSALNVLLYDVLRLTKKVFDDGPRAPRSEQASFCRAISSITAELALEMEGETAEVARAAQAPPEVAQRVPGSVTFRTATTVEYPGNWGSNKSTFECPDMASEFFEQQKKVNGSRGPVTSSRVLLVEHDGLLYSLGKPVTVVPKLC
jgi:hypothetical protein